MREILFRGKNRDGVWLYGDLRQNANTIETDGIDLGGDTFIEPHEYGETLYSVDYYVVNPDTVGQFTGLTDKNGVRIFEGDIVCCNGCFTGPYNALVEFFDSAWTLTNPHMPADTMFPYDLMEVIGNIHDNPDLIA